MIDQKHINRIVYNSKEFRCENDYILTIREYYDVSNVIRIDLSKLTPEILAEISPDDEEEEE